MGYKVAIVGATGTVGREILNILSERAFPADEIVALASAKSIGRELSFGENDVIKVHDLDTFDFSDIDLVLSSPGAKVSAQHTPRAANSGAVVIDNTSHFRMDPNVPLVIPEVNPDDLNRFAKKNIVANPNCSTIQMLTVLCPLHQLMPIKRVIVTTFQSVSGTGKSGMDELFNQTRGIFVNQPFQDHQNNFTKQISFNCIPHIDHFMEDGSTREEWKMEVETKKILDPDIQVHATCVRVPVFIGHSEALNIEFDGPVSEEDITEELKSAQGVTVIDHRTDGGYVTPAECAGEDPVYVSRIRRDRSLENTISMWVVSDNLRKGAALNSVQIAELLVKDHLPSR